MDNLRRWKKTKEKEKLGKGKIKLAMYQEMKEVRMISWLVGIGIYVSWLTSFLLNQKVVIGALTNCNDHM